MKEVKLVLQNDSRDVSQPWQYVARAMSCGKYTFDRMADDISHCWSLMRTHVVSFF